MERMKKMLSSPISRKKNIAQPPPSNHGNQSVTTATTRYIGTPLPELVKRENSQIPHLVTKVCLYIYKNGMELEGVFRVNGNSRVVERLRSSFDQTGDADLEEAGDVMAVAGLLKLFLRELPDGLIPEQLTKTFVSVQEDYASDHETCLVKLRSLLEQLPRTEYEALKYIASFLVLLAKQAAANKMNPMALGIVFGPNLFRCSGGIQGLKDQGITNHIALKFITCYDRLFLEDGEMSPNSPGFVLKTPVLSKKVAPPRPPQPTVEANMPIPSPRKSKNKPNGTISHHLHIPRLHLNPELIAMTTESGNHSDEDGIDTNRSNSPFTLESDRSEFSALMSPRVPPPHNQALDSVISSAVKELLFGDSTSGHSSDDSTNSQNKCAPVAAPRRKRRQGDQAGGSTEKGELERQLSVKDRITRLQAGDGLTDSREDGRPKKQRPTSKAFEMFEKQGLVIGMAPADFSSSLRANEQQQQASDDNSSSESSGRESPNQPAPVAKNPPPKRPSSPPRIQQPSSEERVPQFGDMYENSHIILPAFKRPSGPSNRRTPSRPQRQAAREPQQTEDKTGNNNYTEQHDGPPPPPKPRPFCDEVTDAETPEDVNHNATKPHHNATKPNHSATKPHHNATKPSMSFLNQRDDLSPDKSPTAGRKPYVPPLDLSILHEHGDGSDAIPAEQGYSVSLQKANQCSDEDVAVLSPRMSKLKFKKSSQSDTDVPPSPPTDQTRIPSKRGVDDENAVLIKQLTKKIQSCKKRIKLFEEGFEQDHGYRPSQTDKASQPEIKRSMLELQKARKELRKVKEDIEVERRAATSSPSGLAVLPNGRTMYDDRIHSPEQPPTMEQTLHILLKKLTDKRTEDNRPEDLAEQTREETSEEKLAVQKALLQFESIHGRPTTKSEKSLMRPLYDRYRSIKRILSKPISPRDKSNELQAVPEDHPIEFTPTPSSTYSTNRDPVRVPSSDREEGEDFLVTKDFRLLKDTIRPAAPSSDNISPDPDDPSQSLHELTVPQLLEEQHLAKSDKKRLRKTLREFEEDFFRQTGSKIQKEDRAPMEAEYHEYKQVKARLKLLDALISKHDPLGAY